MKWRQAACQARVGRVGKVGHSEVLSFKFKWGANPKQWKQGGGGQERERRRAGKESDEKRGRCSERVRRVGMDC